MTSQQPSKQERNRLRIQAWEERNQESIQAKELNLENVPLFGQPYKTNKGDELSSRIQRMLGSFDDNTGTEPFIVPSSTNFPLTNSFHPVSDTPYESPKDSCANLSSKRDFNSPECQKEDESSQVSCQDGQLIHSSLQKSPHHEKNFASDLQPFPAQHCPGIPKLEANANSQFTTSDEPQCCPSAENTSCSSENNMHFSTKGTSPALNRIMTHSQAFIPPLSYKQTNTAMMQKPTAYVRPMDGPDVVTESPELKPSPEYFTSVPDVTLDKSAQGKANALPQFLEALTSDILCVEQILNEMTCSWPPLLSGILSPSATKAQSSVKENPSKQENEQIFSDQLPSQHKSSIDMESDHEGGAVSNSSKSEDYRSPSPKLSSLKDVLQSSVSVFSPARETNPPKTSQRTVKFPTTQLSCTQENQGLQSCHKSHSATSPLESPLHVEPVKNDLQNCYGGVRVHFDPTPSQEEKSKLKERPKVKTEGRRPKKCESSVVSTDLKNEHNKNKDKIVGQCTACLSSKKSCRCSSSEYMTPACGCCTSNAEHKRKKGAGLSQKDKGLHGCTQHLTSSKNSLSLVVKINLNLLLKIPRTSESLEIPHSSKDDKPQKVTNGRKSDKGDQYCPKKKLKLQSNNPHTARLENPNSSEATVKRSTSSATKDCSQKSKKHQQSYDNAPQLNKEEVKCPNNPKKSSGKLKEESTVKNLIREVSSNRPLLKFEDRQYPVKHYIKEAKRLKHKADAEMDKLCKIFHYLNGALFFIESGVAMERDPQISMSSYTMFAETVELIKFVLKLMNWDVPTPRENDILALSLRCQSLLQMAMFHHKEKTAISYSKTLIDHFNSSSPSSADSLSCVKGKNISASPANPLMSSGLSGPISGVNGTPGGSVIVPQNLGQVALTYVNITTLFLSAHDLWEQAEEFANKGSGLLTELNKAMGVLSLTSTMSFMVRYIRQGLHWLQMDCLKVKRAK